MSGIGAALREARSRARIEIAQVESQTKIRAKYLRALENEEWELLPGPTYVKSFLRTYGDAVGLDGRALVADYKRSYESQTVVEDHVIRGTGAAERSLRLWLVLASVLVIAAAAAAWQMTRTDGKSDAPSATTSAPVGTSSPAASTPATSPGAASGVVQVDLTASRTVVVCARAGARVLVGQRELRPGQRATGLRGRAVLVTVSGPGVQLRVDGERTALPSTTNASQTFSVSASGVRASARGVTACRS